jgi:rhodanese-related sulfurtransferase
VDRLETLIEELSTREAALVLGSGRSAVAEALGARGVDATVVAGDWPSIQLTRRYPLVIIEAPHGPDDTAAIVHCGVQHLDPGGELILMIDAADAGARFDLRETDRFVVESSEIVRYARTQRTTIHDRVFAARCRIARVDPHGLAGRLERADAPTVIDTRTATDRGRFGVIAGSIHVPRTLVEWHLDPANGYRHPAVGSFEQPLVLVCNGGYSSSLAAESLMELGFRDVADLIGGMRAWIGAGFSVVEPDHSHLDL